MSLLTKKGSPEPKPDKKKGKGKGARSLTEIDQDLREVVARRAQHDHPIDREATMIVINNLLDERLEVTG